MTTLPQTTMRLPRPTGPSAMPVPYAAPTALAAGGGLQMTPADVWRVLRANFWLIALFLVLSAGAGYGTYRLLLKYLPLYTAVGYVQVQNQYIEDPMKDRTVSLNQQELQVELKTHAQLLRNEALWSEALKNPLAPIRETSWFKSFPDATQAKKDLKKRFRALPVTDSKLLLVQMTCPEPGDAALIVRSLVDLHLEQQRAMLEKTGEKKTQLLRNLKDLYWNQLRDLQDRERQLHTDLTAKGMSSPGRFSMLDAQLQNLVKQMVDAGGKAAEAQAMLETVTQQLVQNMDPPQVEQMIEMDGRIRELNFQIDQLDIRRETELLRLGPDHPQIAQLERQKEAYQRKVRELRDENRAKAVVRLMDQLRAEARAAAEEYRKTKEAVDSAKADMAELSAQMATYLSVVEDQKAIRELYQQVSEQLQNLLQVVNLKQQDRVIWANLPEKPELPSRPNFWWTMAGAVLIGLGLALGIAFLREITDTTVRSPRDIARVGQLTLLGMVPDEGDDPQTVSARLPLVIFDAPHSITAEQFRQVRTRLQHAASLDTTRTIMVTGASPGDGKTTVACNLAAGLALNGRKILLVDGNFRRPELHRLFQVPNEQGFSDVLTGTRDFAELAYESQIPNLSVMPSGPKPPNPTELFESQLLVDFIERALEEYDHVIFDSGPFLVVSEAVALAPRVDGVVTVARAHEDRRGQLQRMRDILRQVKAEHLGVVLNAVRAQGGGYYGRSIKTYYEYEA